MSYETYGLFTAPDSPVVLKNVPQKFEDNLKKGQNDGRTKNNQASNYTADKGFFRVLLWNFQASANFHAAAGVSTGNVTDTFCTILKNQGENSAFAYKAMFTRATFNFELYVTEKLGNDENTLNTKLIFSNCVFTKVASATGNPMNVLAAGAGGGGTAATTSEYVGSDTKELDSYTFVYQGLNLDTFGSKAVVSLMGKSKSGS